MNTTSLYRYITIYEPRTCLWCGRALHTRMCAPLKLFIDPEQGPCDELGDTPGDPYPPDRD